MSRSILRGVAVTGVAALAFAAPATAFAAGHAHHTAKAHQSNKHHGKPAAKRFTAVGVVAGVDAATGTVTITDKGGSKDLHGKTVTVVVSTTTKVVVDDASATLADVQVGDHVMANGLRADGALNARHVNAAITPEPDASESESPAPDVTPTDAPAADSTPTDAPTDTPSTDSSPTTSA